MTEGYKSKRLSRRQTIAAFNLMEKCLHQVPGSDVWKYDEGWSDAKVAQEVGLEGALVSVGNVRREMFGSLIGAPGTTSKPDSSATLDLIAELTERVIKAERNIKRLAIEAGIDLKDAT